MGKPGAGLSIGGAFVFPETPGVTQMESLTPCFYVPRIKGTNDQTAGALLLPTKLRLDLCALAILALALVSGTQARQPHQDCSGLATCVQPLTMLKPIGFCISMSRISSARAQ